MGKSFSKVGDGRGSDAHVGKLSHTDGRVEGGVEQKIIGVAGLTKDEDLVSFGSWLTLHLDGVLASPRESNNHLINRDIGGGKKKAGKILLKLGGEGRNLVCQSTWSSLRGDTWRYRLICWKR